MYSKIQNLVAPMAKLPIKGSVEKRAGKLDGLLESFFEEIYSHNKSSIEMKKLQSIMDSKFFLNVKLKPVPKGSEYAGCLARNYNKKGMCVGYEMHLPFKEESGKMVLPLNGNNVDTLMHETSHMIHYASEPKYIASDFMIEKTTGRVLEKLDMGFTPVEVEKIKGGMSVKTHVFYDDKMYNCEMEPHHFRNFKNKYKSGDEHLKEVVELKRQKVFERKLDEFLDTIPDDQIRLAALRKLEKGMRTEDLAFSQGAKYKAQFNINRQVQYLVENDDRVSELMALKKLNSQEYEKEINKYFEKANINRRNQRLSENIEDNNKVYYYFSPKADLVRNKAFKVIEKMRNKLKAQRAQSLYKSQPV